MRFRRDQKQLIQDNITGFISRGVEDETSLVMDSVARSVVRGRDLFFNMLDSRVSREILLISSSLFLKKSSRKVRTLLVVPTMDRLDELKEVYKSLNPQGHKTVFLDEQVVQQELKNIRRAPILIVGTAVRIIDHLRRGNLDISGAYQVLLDNLPEDTDYQGFLKDVSFIFTRCSKKIQTFLFSASRESADLFLPQLNRYEELRMPVISTPKEQQKENEIMAEYDSEAMQAAIEIIVNKVRNEEDPEKLKEFRKIYKKSVPMGLRPWVTAYLFKNAVLKSGRSRGGAPPKINRIDNGVNLFVGIGRKRKIYPKDLIHLFITKGGLKREDIGEIKILDSYSFVSVTKDTASEAIDKMDGLAFRGRKLNVNYAKQK